MMLVVTRRRGERIKITVGGVELWITVLDVKGGRTKLGCDAAQEVIFERYPPREGWTDNLPGRR